MSKNALLKSDSSENGGAERSVLAIADASVCTTPSLMAEKEPCKVSGEAVIKDIPASDVAVGSLAKLGDEHASQDKSADCVVEADDQNDRGLDEVSDMFAQLTRLTSAMASFGDASDLSVTEETSLPVVILPIPDPQDDGAGVESMSKAA